MLNQLFNSITHYSSLGLLICAIILFVHCRHDPATRILITIFFIGGWIAMVFILRSYGLAIPPPSLLRPGLIVSGTFAALMFCYYPVALVRIDLFKFRYFLLSLIPFFVQVLILYIAARNGMKFRFLTSFPDIVEHIAEPNVWLRLLLIAVPYIYVVALVIFTVRVLRRKEVRCRRLFIIAVMGPGGMGVFYILGNLFFPVAGKAINHIWGLLYVVATTYYIVKSKKTPAGFVTAENPEMQGQLVAFMTEVPSRLLTSVGEMEFRRHFTLTYPSFIAQLRQKYPAMTPAEETLTMLIRMNTSNQEIARLLGINLSSVHTSRSRLRKKLDIGKAESLDEYVHAI